jgi:hypothetical protein
MEKNAKFHLVLPIGLWKIGEYLGINGNESQC